MQQKRRNETNFKLNKIWGDEYKAEKSVKEIDWRLYNFCDRVWIPATLSESERKSRVYEIIKHVPVFSHRFEDWMKRETIWFFELLNVWYFCREKKSS